MYIFDLKPNKFAYFCSFLISTIIFEHGLQLLVDTLPSSAFSVVNPGWL